MAFGILSGLEIISLVTDPFLSLLITIDLEEAKAFKAGERGLAEWDDRRGLGGEMDGRESSKDRS